MINEKMKWPSDKQRYDANYLRVFGELCPRCYGTGKNASAVYMDGSQPPCLRCHGLGYVEKQHVPVQ